MTLVVNRYTALCQSHSREWLFCLLLCFTLAGCERPAQTVKLTGATMGTTWHVTYLQGKASPDADQATRNIQSRLDAVNASMSTYQPASEISRFNSSALGEWFAASAGFVQVLETAQLIGHKSEGAYDITVGPLVELWGFGSAGAVSAPPEPAQVARLLQSVGLSGLQIDAAQSRIKKLHALSLDVSSIAKGYAVDEVALWLLSNGVSDFLVEVGGEMRVAGKSARGDSWRIAIEQPEAGDRAVAAAITLSAGAVATSGDYRNFFEVAGKRYSHSIDPRTGYPVAHDLVSVTVVHDSAMLADGWATALTVLGGERAMALAQTSGLAVYFIRRTPAGFEHSYTDAFAAFVETDDNKTEAHKAGS
jgi:thiamine biosynthesis lipoprotein